VDRTEQIDGCVTAVRAPQRRMGLDGLRRFRARQREGREKSENEKGGKAFHMAVSPIVFRKIAAASAETAP
jgi:hypothetical protein